jgi:nicotinamide-nucleotide amidase
VSKGPIRPLLTAELLSIGTELTTGETRDTNAGELARSLSDAGVRVRRLTAIPDHLETVADAFAAGLARSDLVVSTGGLGPTPDDLTREAIATAVGEAPVVDPALEAWLRALWDRRGLPFLSINLKQAWLIPSATPIPNANGTAPGWWVDRADGRAIAALPGPPREIRPMWHDWVMPRLRARGSGVDSVTRTYRLTGIGESAVADLLGEQLLRARNPAVATYARADAVDVRISAVAAGDRTAGELVEAASQPVLAALSEYIWATGTTTWADAIGARLAERGWTLATWEQGTGGTLAALLGGLPALVRATTIGAGAAGTGGSSAEEPDEAADPMTSELAAAELRASTGASVACALRVTERGPDAAVSVAVATPSGVHRERRVAFLGGVQGRHRAALIAAAIVLERLRDGG